MKGPGAHWGVIRLQDSAALLGPVALQSDDEILKGHGVGNSEVKRGLSRSKARASIASFCDLLGTSRTPCRHRAFCILPGQKWLPMN